MIDRIAFGGRIKVSCKTLNLPHANYYIFNFE